MSVIKATFNKLLKLARKIKLKKFLTGSLVIAIFISATFTYFAITNPDMLGIANDPVSFSNLLILNILLLLLLAIVVSTKLVHLWSAREKGRVGSRLLMKLVIMFSVVAILPAVIVGLSSSFYLNLGIKSWFNERVNDAVIESVKVADAYLMEHKENIKADAVRISGLIGNDAMTFALDSQRLQQFLNMEASRDLLSDVIVFQRDKEILAASRMSFELDPLNNIDEETFDRLNNGEIVTITDNDEKVTAIVRLISLPNAYLQVSRFIDDKVLAHSRQAHLAADEYLKLKRQIADFQVKSTVFFILMASFLLLGALWMAFRFANNLVAPVTSLVAATERVKHGEYRVRVKEGPLNDEIGVLSRSFNQMAEELEQQKRSLMLANREAEEKGSFTEAVLADLSSGVMAVDGDKKIELMNNSAREILVLSDKVIGRYLRDAVPEFFEALEEAEQKKIPSFQKEVSLRRKLKRMNFIVRISPKTAKNAEGYILTFDDITELVSAQRSAAWSDVARKIAHEIKNPLTPINLSAQRLAKKYTKIVPEDERENFEGYTNTITRHTADIANIIQEFSNFAKMPAPKFSKVDIAVLLKDAIFSARLANSKIEFALDMPDKMETVADPIQITQVLTNVIKNAAESVGEKNEGGKGNISAVAKVSSSNIEIVIDDNGKGFPEELIDRLTEPYVTTRQKGTGLGLAIVKKIMQDHNGKIDLLNIKGGARVILTLPIV